MGYEVHEAVREADDTLRVISWTPVEISMTTNAADLAVGIGRSKNTENELLIRDELMTTESKQDDKHGKPLMTVVLTTVKKKPWKQSAKELQKFVL